MSKRSGTDILVARTTFWTSLGGRQVLVYRGDTAEPGAPITVGCEDMFAPLRVKYPAETQRAEQSAPEPVEGRVRASA
jgi:hypothetical protein